VAITTPVRPTTTATALRGQKLPRWAVPAVAVAALALTGVLFSATGTDSAVGFVLTAGLLFAAVLTGASFALEGSRQARDRLATTAVYTAFLLAMAPLVSISLYTVARGIARLDNDFLWSSMFLISPSAVGGGAYHAIIGSLLVTAITAVLAVPLGVLTAVYLVEYGEGRRLARAVSFFVDVMTGVPSIVAGLFVFTFWILVLGFQQSGFAGALALVILMLPVVVRSTEEMLKLVPQELREASYALGIPKWKTVTRVVLPTAFSGIVTGVMLGIARAMGETAPLLLLVGTQVRINFDPFGFSQTQSNPISTLPTYIFSQLTSAAGSTTAPAFDRAWAAALVLIILIMLLNLVARSVARFAKARG
jgi:phosphate transport system permease protein